MSDNQIHTFFNRPQSLSPNTAIKQSPDGNYKDYRANKTNGDFRQILEQEQKTIKFSQHALDRMQSRQIKLNEAELDTLSQAVDKAEKKGARESLVLMNKDLALVVSVKNRTVITAMDGDSMKENVFTNIDSAVII